LVAAHARALEETQEEGRREMRRRTGALAEQHAQSMQDRERAHAEELRESQRQVRLAQVRLATLRARPPQGGSTGAQLEEAPGVAEMRV
jgi:predicted phage gp36 major capsid-like protein